MRTKILLPLLCALSVLSFAPAALAAEEAQIPLKASVDLHPVVALESGSEGMGFGFDLRGNYALKMEGFTLSPEALFGWNSFGAPSGVSSSLWRLAAGARASFDLQGMVPSAFAHLGFGSMSTSVKFGGATISGSDSTALFELGGALDFPVADKFMVGGNLAFHHLLEGSGFSYLTFGAQGTYQF